MATATVGTPAVPQADPQADALAALDALGPVDAPAEADKAPAKARRSHSGTSRADRKAKAGGAPAAPRVRAPRAPSVKRPNIGSGMAGFYTMAGLAVSVIPSGLAVAGPGAGSVSVTGVTGRAMVANSTALGAAWEVAAKDDPRIREALEKLLAVSTYGAILAAHLPVVMAAGCAVGAVPVETMMGLGLLDGKAPEFADEVAAAANRRPADG